MKKPEQRLPAEERKKQILKCAVTVFARSNYRGTKVADIAAEAGISEAAVYKYFPTKKSIFLEVIQHMSKRIITFWQDELDKEEKALNVLKNMGTTYLRRMLKHPEELKVQFQAISEVDDKDILDQLHQDHENYIRFVEKVVRKGIKQGTIRKDLDVASIAFLFDGLGILINMMKLLSFEKTFNEERLIKIVDHLIDSMKA